MHWDYHDLKKLISFLKKKKKEFLKITIQKIKNVNKFLLTHIFKKY